MALGRLWAGRAFGTNIGNLFVKLEGEDDALSGTLHLNDDELGFVVYSISGAFDGNQITFTGESQTEQEGISFGALRAAATLTARGALEGEWATSIGSAGTFVLHPHDRGQSVEPVADRQPDQLHTARYTFGAVEVDLGEITALAEDIQRDFKNAKVVVTVVAGTEQSRFLEDFKIQRFSTERAVVIKLFVQEPEESGVNRIAQVEFGPQTNLVMTQSADEAWVLGMLEKLKRSIRPSELHDKLQAVRLRD